MAPFICVRISWLMFARNSLLSTLADSAAILARPSSSITRRLVEKKKREPWRTRRWPPVASTVALWHYGSKYGSGPP